MLELLNLFDVSFYLNQHSDAIEVVENTVLNRQLDHCRLKDQFADCHPHLFEAKQQEQRRSPEITKAIQLRKLYSGLDPHLQWSKITEQLVIPPLNERIARHNHPKIDSIHSLNSEKIVRGLTPLIDPEKSASRDRTTQTVILWNEATQQAVRNTSPGPTVSSRAYSVVHTAMFDAWASYDPVAIGTQLADQLQRPPKENTLSNKSEAISYAAYSTLIDLFPTQQQVFDDLMQQLGYSPTTAIASPQTPRGIGQAASTAVLRFCHKDGSNQLNSYADTTNYQPVNPSESLSDLNRWQPLRVPLNDPKGRLQAFLTPHWGTVIPFGLTSGSQFRPPAPPDLATPLYRQRVQEILDYNANLTDEHKIIAEYWEDGPGTSFPPGKWMAIGQYISQRDNHSLDEDVKLFFMLANALFDAGIAAWDSKRFYDYIRPVSAIRSLFNGQQIQAWAGPGKGTQTIDGSQWHPYQRLNDPTPPFPEYVSGHSSYSAAAAEVLKRYTKSDHFGASYTAPVGSSRFEPGITPTQEITLSWPTFSAAADQAGISRLYGGIHFRDGDLNGRILGRKVGETVWNKAQTFINGGGRSGFIDSQE
ncbi:vanadium-dependent haloperoxidase [Limnoraphis robusta]|uniref:vanadium-dependent haloperoxidase n=1 Tax=Limnoraphis robusta TaxID=1118279 RepID=UPI002B219324|nr:vanadium-dependent haloperoxidase [Limnoraphis robusta]MEA5500391.1 vanadium-dependent haloperoxidase [Limnoraphis robusta BA-68 BA1]